jgi:hypothetical protein
MVFPTTFKPTRPTELPPNPLQNKYDKIRQQLSTTQTTSTIGGQALQGLINNIFAFEELTNKELLSHSKSLNKWKSVLTKNFGFSECEISTLLETNNKSRTPNPNPFSFFNQIVIDENTLSTKLQIFSNYPKQHIRAVFTSANCEEFQRISDSVMDPQTYAGLKQLTQYILQHVNDYLEAQEKLCKLDDDLTSSLEQRKELQTFTSFLFCRNYCQVQRNFCKISVFSQRAPIIRSQAQIYEILSILETQQVGLKLADFSDNTTLYQSFKKRQISPIAVLCEAYANPNETEQKKQLLKHSFSDCMNEIRTQIPVLQSAEQRYEQIQLSKQAEQKADPNYCCGFPWALRGVPMEIPSFVQRSAAAPQPPAPAQAPRTTSASPEGLPHSPGGQSVTTAARPTGTSAPTTTSV